MLATPNLVPSTSYSSEIQSMMFGFGDCNDPKIETASVIEEIVHQQMTEVLFRASDVAQRRSAKMVSLEDVLFLMRKSPVKIQRLIKYLNIRDVSTNLLSATSTDQSVLNQPSKRVKRCKDFMLKIDNNGLLEKAVNEELYDEVRMERLKRMDRLSRDLDERKYAEFTRARQVNFMGQKMKYPQKFMDWLTKDTGGWLDLKIDKSAMEIFSYLAYETVGHLVELSLLVRREIEAGPNESRGRSQPVAFNPQFPMVQLSQLHSVGIASPSVADESPQLRKRLKSGTISTGGGVGGPSGSANSDSGSGDSKINLKLNPLEPGHVREAVRRLKHGVPKSALTWYEKVDMRHQSHEGEMPILVL